MILTGGRVLTDVFEFKDAAVEICGSKIERVTEEKLSGGYVLDCSGCYVVPGLIDVHTHGCLGFDYTTASEEEIIKMTEYTLLSGVTSLLPTFLTSPRDVYITAASRVKNTLGRTRGSKILGIHLEGPYYSKEYKGAQNDAFIRKPSAGEFGEINAASGGMVRLVSLAPEAENANEFIKEASKSARVAIGHTAAGYEEAKRAIQCGASQITHTFNGMAGLHHRSPGVIGAAFESEGVLCECICDGFHLHPSVVRLLFSSVGEDRVVLITDSIAPAGLSDGEAVLGGLSVLVRDKKAYLSDGKTIAGSTVTLLDCVKNAISFGIRPEAAFKAATINAARSAGADRNVGSLTKGKDADILILDSEYNIKHIIVNGELK